MIPIKNWLKSAQRFNVTWKFDNEDKTIFVNAANTFDVAGDTTKDYKLSIYALKACQSKLELIFKNPNTQEFISFKVNITVQPPDPMARIDLQSVVRESVTKLITIENPLSTQVEIKKEMLTVDSDMVLLQPNSFVIPPKS
jgi:hydrocephalus-inducing protein